MAAGINDKFKRTFNSDNPNVTFVTTSRSGGATTLICDNLTGWPTDTAVDFITYQLDTDGETVVAGSQRDWKGIVSTNTITNLTLIAGGSDAGNQVNDIVEMTPTGNWANDLIEGILVSHNQDGTLKNDTVTTAKIDDEAVTTAKIDDEAVTTAKIDDGAVTIGKIDTTSFSSDSASVATDQSTTSSSYTDLSTVGPAVTVDITGSGKALVVMSAGIYGSNANNRFMSFAVSGASTVAASDNFSFGHSETNAFYLGNSFLVTGLTPGSNTFTAKYKTLGGTGNFLRRRIEVIAL